MQAALLTYPVPLCETARMRDPDPAEWARRRDIAPRPLRATAGDGPPTYRTGLEGWYLTRDGGIGVDVDGRYYLLTSPRSLRARLVGVTVPPSDPPVQVGAGGRDGESIALDALLTLRLDAGGDWRVPG